MQNRIIDVSNKISYHIVIGLFSFGITGIFLSLGLNLGRATAATAFILLFLVMIIGPIMRLWNPLVKVLPWGIPWSWRGELGIWFAFTYSSYILPKRVVFLSYIFKQSSWTNCSLFCYGFSCYFIKKSYKIFRNGSVEVAT